MLASNFGRHIVNDEILTRRKRDCQNRFDFIAAFVWKALIGALLRQSSQC